MSQQKPSPVGMNLEAAAESTDVIIGVSALPAQINLRFGDDHMYLPLGAVRTVAQVLVDFADTNNLP